MPQWLTDRGDIFVVHKNTDEKTWQISHKATGCSIGICLDTTRKKATENFIEVTKSMTEFSLNESITRMAKIRQKAVRRS